MGGMIAGVVISLLCVLITIFWPPIVLDEKNTHALLALWFKVNLAVIFWLLITIALLARHRFFHTEDIDAATGTPNSAKALMLQSILQNTLEQSVLAVTVYGAWIFLAPQNWKTLPVIFALLFSIGRLLFITRYKNGASARSFGFAFTFFPSIFLLFTLITMQISTAIPKLL